MGQILHLGLCLLGFLIFNPSVEGAGNATAASRSLCGEGVLYYRRHCYELVGQPASWASAEIKCQERNARAQLASILSANEGEIVTGYLKSFSVDGVWIGLQATYSSMQHMLWQWSDGSSFGSPLWDGHTPSAATSLSRCISLHNLQSTDSPKWLQRLCSDNLPFLCKYRATY